MFERYSLGEFFIAVVAYLLNIFVFRIGWGLFGGSFFSLLIGLVIFIPFFFLGAELWKLIKSQFQEIASSN